jgi:hypothetical protein
VVKCARAHGLDARPVGGTEIQIGDPRTGPRIKFLLSTGAAESLQFKGGAQGAEQIENALLYVHAASDKVAKQLENCIAKTV